MVDSSALPSPSLPTPADIANGRCRLLEIPAELRLAIFEFLFAGPRLCWRFLDTVTSDHTSDTMNTHVFGHVPSPQKQSPELLAVSLAQTCRLLKKEVPAEWYSKARWIFEIAEASDHYHIPRCKDRGPLATFEVPGGMRRLIVDFKLGFHDHSTPHTLSNLENVVEFANRTSGLQEVYLDLRIWYHQQDVFDKAMISLSRLSFGGRIIVSLSTHWMRSLESYRTMLAVTGG